MEEFEVIPDWGYYAPFPYSPERLQQSMARLLPMLESVDPQSKPRLPLAPTMAEYRKSLSYYADLFERLASMASALERASKLAKDSGRMTAKSGDLLSLVELEDLLATAGDFPQRAALQKLVDGIKKADVAALRKGYASTVYGIYDAGIPAPVDPRRSDATNNLFNHFHGQLAMPPAPSVIKPALRATGKPYLWIGLGQVLGERGWTLDGWTPRNDEEGVAWRASFDQPGTLRRDDFQDQGYRWLIVRLTEGPAGGRKTVALNGQVIGQFVAHRPGGQREEGMVRHPLLPHSRGTAHQRQAGNLFYRSGHRHRRAALCRANRFPRRDERPTWRREDPRPVSERHPRGIHLPPSWRCRVYPVGPDSPLLQAGAPRRVGWK